MTNSIIQDQIKARIAMMGEYISRINPLAGDDDATNIQMMAMADDCQAEIDRLNRTLAVRETAAQMRIA